MTEISNNGLRFNINNEKMVAYVTDSPNVSGNVFIPRYLEYDGYKYLIWGIGGMSFKNCHIETLSFANDSFVQYFMKNAFEDAYIKNLEIPASLKNIDSSLHSIKQLDSITVSPHNKLFKYEQGFLLGKSEPNNDTFDVLHFISLDIEEAIIPPEVKIVKSYTIGRNHNIKSVIFQEDSEPIIIERYAFGSSIRKLVLPAKIQSISYYNFTWCDNLVEIKVSPNNPNFSVIGNDFLVTKGTDLSTGMDEIIFARRDIETVIIPSFIKTIACCAFENCTKIRSFTFEPNSSLYSIHYCSLDRIKLKGCITFPESLDKVHEEALSNSEIESLEFLGEKLKLGENFVKFSEIKKISFPNAKDLVFDNCRIFPENAKIFVRKDAKLSGDGLRSLSPYICYFDDKEESGIADKFDQAKTDSNKFIESINDSDENKHKFNEEEQPPECHEQESQKFYPEDSPDYSCQFEMGLCEQQEEQPPEAHEQESESLQLESHNAILESESGRKHRVARILDDDTFISDGGHEHKKSHHRSQETKPSEVHEQESEKFYPENLPEYSYQCEMGLWERQEEQPPEVHEQESEKFYPEHLPPNFNSADSSSDCFKCNPEEPNPKLQEENGLKEDIKKLRMQLQNQLDLSNKFQQQIIEFQQQIIEQEQKTQKELNEQKLKILSLEKLINNIFDVHSFTVKLSLKEPGILSRLKNNEQTPFDHFFIASQSTSDIYNLIDPRTKDCFTLNSIGKFFEIEFRESIAINGVQLFSSESSFPKSFDIEIDDKKVASISEANELNGKDKNTTIKFDSILGKKIRIISTGPNWDKNTNFVKFKRIELLSPENKYSRGVFNTLVSLYENHDPHKCPLIISASDFDLSNFYSIDTLKNICTYSVKNSWFQIEFTNSVVILSGFRLKRCKLNKMKSYKIICTDDVYKPEEEWSTLFEIDEKNENDHKMLDIYEFPEPSPPVKFIRLIQTGKNWNNKISLQFFHFDVFGKVSYVLKK